jgi:SAM-dependent methyltransferase
VSRRSRRSPHPVERWYPEVAAGGYSKVDGSVEFYQRIQALLRPDMRVVDFGAGRGAFLDDEVELRRELHRLDKVAAEVIGLDVDDAVLTNPCLTRAEVITPGKPLPVESGSVDLIVSDWVFEHIADPIWAAAELDRILKPGGWLCARTPNKHGYIGLGARAVPNRLHVALLRAFQPSKQDRDTFPTTYRLNTPAALREHFPGYEHVVYTMNNEPAYVSGWRAGWALMQAVFRATPDRLGATLYVFLRKP